MKKGRLIIAVVIALFSVISYFRMSQTNPVTGEKQRIDISPSQEIALGLQAAPEMAQEFGGLDPDQKAQAMVDQVGQRVVARSGAARAPYKFDFHLLADGRTVNAFALPGGQIFITRALMSRLGSEGELAGVLGHEVGHVVGRHSAEQMAKQRLTQGLTGAAVIATIDPNDPSTVRNAAMAQMVAQLISLKHTRSDELEADQLGVRFIAESGYDPRSLIGVMEVLKKAGGGGGPEFFQTHPNPDNRVAKIKEAIQKEFPGGVPAGLTR
jgi:predicted Zn-dependent protease